MKMIIKTNIIAESQPCFTVQRQSWNHNSSLFSRSQAFLKTESWLGLSRINKKTDIPCFFKFSQKER